MTINGAIVELREFICTNDDLDWNLVEALRLAIDSMDELERIKENDE